MMGDPESFDRALGALLARRRNLAGTTQADLARTAQRYCGLSWTAATGAPLESGRRQWKVAGGFLLPVLLQKTEGGGLELPQILEELGQICTRVQSTVSGSTTAFLKYEEQS